MKPLCNKTSHLLRNSMPFASHQQDTLGGKLCGIDIFPVKIGTHYIHPFVHTFYKFE